MTGPVVEPAPAKINLALHLRRRRADGYHDIETLFAFCRHGDVVTVTDADTDTFVISGPFADTLDSSTERGGGARANLVTIARDAFLRVFDVTGRHAIALEKNLPVASGIGGGSADAAATLRALACRHGVAPDDPRLVAIAATLGADVPACLHGNSALGTGRGDDLTRVPGWRDTPVLLVNPRVAVSTAAVFAGWDGRDRGPLHPADPATARNDLEAPARAIAPVIADVLALLAAQPGVTLVRMSGSGATCFALFADTAARDDADAEIGVTHPSWWRLATTLA